MSVLKVHRYNNSAFSSDFLLEGTYLKLRFVTRTFWIKIQKNSHSTASTVQKAHQAQRKRLRRKRSVVHARTYVRRREPRARRMALPTQACAACTLRFRKALSPARRCAERGGDYATTVVPQRLPSVLLTCCSALCIAAATLGIKRYFSLDTSLKLWSFRLLSYMMINPKWHGGHTFISLSFLDQIFSLIF